MKNSLTEPPFIPVWARELEADLFFIYNGPSMASLFKPGDLLCAKNPVYRSIRAGDVVIVHRKNETNRTEYIIHRVILVMQNYMITQGDNNLNLDPQVVTSENLVGLVNYFGRQGHIYSIRGGNLGLFYARIIHTRITIWLLIKRLCWQVYHHIRKSGLVSRVWRPDISRIRLITDNGPLVKYSFGKKTVARWWPQQKHFDVLKPFDLVIPPPEDLQ
jgi:signal peptidase I